MSHRFTVAEVGTALAKFSSPKGMMRAIYDAFKAHKEAYEKCRILHQDISGGNIPILDDGSGILNYWDLAPDISQIGQAGRTVERTVSHNDFSPLDNASMFFREPGRLCRSCCWKFRTRLTQYGMTWNCYSGLSCITRCSTITEALDEIVDKVFMDMYFPARDGRPRGGVGKVALLNGAFIGFKADPSLEFTDCRPLSRFIKSVTNRLRGWYVKTNDILATHHRNPSPAPEKSMWEGDPLQKLHADVEDLWMETLNAADWPDNNPPTQRAGNRVFTKHSRDEEDNDPDIRVPPSKKIRSSRR